MSIAPQPFSQQPPPFAETNDLPGRHSTTGASMPAIPSEQLLCGQACVTIDHEGVHYVLRATRAGKLILTK